MDGNEDESILSIFLEEAGEIVEQLSDQLDELHYGYDGERILDDIHRGFHTLKGGAAVIGSLEPMVECSGMAEQILDSLRTKRLSLSPGLVSLIMSALNSVEMMLNEARKGEAVRPITDELRDRLHSASGRAQEREAAEKAGKTADFKPLEGGDEAGEPSVNDPLEFFFGNVRSPRDDAELRAIAAYTGEAITDEEFETLLDNLHGKGRGPTRSVPGEPVAGEAGAEEAAELPESRMRMEQMRSLVNELAWVRSRLRRLANLRSREDLDKALAYLDLVARDMERWVRENALDRDA